MRINYHRTGHDRCSRLCLHVTDNQTCYRAPPLRGQNSLRPLKNYDTMSGVLEIAVLADQRRRAGTALTSDKLEEWHRYALPGFIERMRARIKDHCEEGHQRWPASSRYARHTSDPTSRDRKDIYSRDAQTTIRRGTSTPRERPRLGVVNLETGEITDGPQ
jgi:hypothetical protein